MSRPTSRRPGRVRTVHVAIHTGTHLFAGTDARAWIQLGGPSGRTQGLRIEPEEGGLGRNETAGFTLRFAGAVDPGEIDRVALLHDGTGRNRSWFVDKVVVDGRSLPFDCWLSREEAPYRLDAASLPGDVGRAYTVTITTTDGFLAGTDADVAIQLIGTAATTPWMRLWEPGINNFEQGNADTFRVWCEDIGDLVGAWIRHDDSGLGAGWHVDRVAVDDHEFVVQRWLAAREGDRTLDHLCRNRALFRDPQPLRLRLVTFSDLHDRARRCAAADVGHLGVMLARAGLDVRLLEDDQDVVLEDKWLPFDARHAGPLALVEALRDELDARDIARTPADPIPLLYVGAFEGHAGVYPCLARPDIGILMPTKPHPEATLCHEIGHFFGLSHSDPCDVDGVISTRNPADVVQADRHNPMSFDGADKRVAAARQTFTNGQLEAMVLAMLPYVS